MHDLDQVREKMRLSLYYALKTLFPSGFEPSTVIKPHHWGNPDYVGEVGGKVIWWNGWSANLSHVDKRYRTIYIDYVENVLSETARIKIFGEEFAEAIYGAPEFIVMYVGGFASNLKAKVQDDGFTIRLMGKNIHPCFVASKEMFLRNTELHWAALIARLINYQMQMLGA